MNETIGGLCAGAANMAAGYAFDTVKTRLQASPVGEYNGAVHCLQTIWRQEGVKGFYRGLSTPLVGGSVDTAANYIVRISISSEQNKLERLLCKLACHLIAGMIDVPVLDQVFTSILRRIEAQGKLPQPICIPVAAAATGVALSVLRSPIGLIKSRMQSGIPERVPQPGLQKGLKHFSSNTECVRHLLRTEGWRGLTRGLPATVAMEIPGNGLYFSIYAYLRSKVMQTGQEGSTASSTFTSSSSGSVSGMATTAALCGAFTGVLVWTVILPLDRAKTRIQTAAPGSVNDMGLLHTLAQLLREGVLRGVRQGLYAGYLTVVVRSLPSNAAQWLAWETVIRFLRREDTDVSDKASAI